MLSYSATALEAAQPEVVRLDNSKDGRVYAIDTSGQHHLTTINPIMQNHLMRFLKNKGNPLGAVVVVEVATGKIVAAVEGRGAHQEEVSPLFFADFPTASLFKTIITSAAFDLLDWNGKNTQPLRGGCSSKVLSNGVWLRRDSIARRNKMSVAKAYSQSCNGFFAKLAVEKLGLGAIKQYAKKFAWNQSVPADFQVPQGAYSDKGPVANNKSLSVQSVGEFAAGLGKVYTGVFHAAWQYLMIANSGFPRPLQLFENSTNLVEWPESKRLLLESTTKKLRKIMPGVVQNAGTAFDAFRARRYRKLRTLVGGKTGTLSGVNPKGINTWFAGMVPIQEPRYVVAAVVVINDLWHIRGPDLAAEALWAASFPEKLNNIAILRSASSKRLK